MRVAFKVVFVFKSPFFLFLFSSLSLSLVSVSISGREFANPQDKTRCGNLAVAK